MRISEGKKKADPEIPVVAMADIAFLLIIFFLVTTEMEKLKTQQLKVPDTRESEEKDMKLKNLQISIKGSVAFANDNSYKLPAQLQQLGQVVSRQVSKKKTVPEKVVIVTADLSVEWETWVRVIEEIKSEGGIPTIQTEEVVYQAK